MALVDYFAEHFDPLGRHQKHTKAHWSMIDFLPSQAIDYEEQYCPRPSITKFHLLLAGIRESRVPLLIH